MAKEFVEIEVEAGNAAPDGVSLRFKVAGDARIISRVHYEHEDGTDGWWQVWAVDDPNGTLRRAARAVPVEDSSEGTVMLITGGTHGLLLEHIATGTSVREPYLLLVLTTLVEL